jgi:hypothetical protein
MLEPKSQISLSSSSFTLLSFFSNFGVAALGLKALDLSQTFRKVLVDVLYHLYDIVRLIRRLLGIAVADSISPLSIRALTALFTFLAFLRVSWTTVALSFT